MRPSKEYWRKFEKAYRKGTISILWNQKALQLILNQTNELCIKYGIEFCADIRYGNFLFMTFPDVFSLFENALCNAVNACLQLGEEEKETD